MIIKKITVCFFFLFTCILVKAQFTKIAEGPEFDEPKSGYTQIVQMKNGGTVFFRITLKEGIDIRIYDPNHKEKVATTIDPAYEKLPKTASIAGAFEINGDVVILISTYEDNMPVLNRLIIDGVKGRLKKEDRVRELSKMNMGQGYAMLFGGVKMPGFYAKNNLAGNCYAVAAFNTFESDRNKRIEIIVFGADHKQISRSYYSSPEEKYKFLDYLDMEVMDDQRVSLLVNGYNTRASGGKASEILLGDLAKGSKNITFYKMDLPKDSVVHHGAIKYNPVTQQMIIVVSILEKERSQTVYNYLTIVDPVAQKVVKTIPAVMSDKVYGKSYSWLKKKDDFTGVLRDIYINDDGGFSIAYEEEAIITTQYSTGSSTHSNSHLELNNIAVCVHNKDGEIKSTFLIPKSNWIEWEFYYSADYGFGNQYKKFSYLNKGEKNYILLNDTERNIAKIEKDKSPIKVIGISECDAFYLSLTGTELIPDRQYLFGSPNNNKEHNIASFGVSDYDRLNNIYVTLRAMPSGKEKLAKLVWFKP